MRDYSAMEIGILLREHQQCSDAFYSAVPGARSSVVRSILRRLQDNYRDWSPDLDSAKDFIPKSDVFWNAVRKDGKDYVGSRYLDYYLYTCRKHPTVSSEHGVAQGVLIAMCHAPDITMHLENLDYLLGVGVGGCECAYKKQVEIGCKQGYEAEPPNCRWSAPLRAAIRHLTTAGVCPKKQAAAEMQAVYGNLHWLRMIFLRTGFALDDRDIPLSFFGERP